jgi:hypothetical protein
MINLKKVEEFNEGVYHVCQSIFDEIERLLFQVDNMSKNNQNGSKNNEN